MTGVTTAHRVLVLHGPNLQLLGQREPDVYGHTTLAQLNADLVEFGESLGLQVECLQSNHEGVWLDAIAQAPAKADGLVINPGAWTHTSVAIHDALRSIELPAIEVHLSNLFAREPFRHHSQTAPPCSGVIMGLGTQSYRLGILALQAIFRAP